MPRRGFQRDGVWGRVMAPLRRASMARFLDELRWTFTMPMIWIQSVVLNLVLAAVYMLFQQPNLGGHYDTVLLYCVYFATFILADVTTTNIFGLDVARTTEALSTESFARILMRKNAVQGVVIVVPIVLVTAVWTEYLYHESEMMRTIPGVLYPMLLFMAIGNLISVLFPVAQAPLGWHLRQWRHWRVQVPLLVSYAIPYVIFALWVYTDLPNLLFTMLRDWGSDSFVPPSETATALLLASCVLYAGISALSVWLFRRRGFVFVGQGALIHEAPFDEATAAALAKWHTVA